MTYFFLLGGLHGAVFTILAIFILYSDHQGYLYFRGKKETLSPTFLKWSHRIVWVGLVLMIITGAALLIPTWQFRLQEPVFYLKMGFVLVLLMNAFSIGKFSELSTLRPYRELTTDEQRTLMVSGALSVMGWVGAATIGLFFL